MPPPLPTTHRIHRVYICKFSYLLNLCVTPKSIPLVLLWSFNMCLCTAWKIWVAQCIHSKFRFLFQLSYCKQYCPFAVYFMQCFCVFDNLGVGNFAVWHGPKCSAEVLSSYAKPKKAAMCLMEKIFVR